MCGIAGFASRARLESPPAALERMAAVLAHRGPDGSGRYTDAHVALAHQRLSIVDLESGAQPMYNETGALVIIFNGEIFNHAGIREELIRAGHRFASDHSDTETILHAYEEWGPRALDRFRGMFAFVIWDRDRQRLFCARDRLGIKPFYYFRSGDLFVFASEIKALLEHPAVPARFEESLLPEYLAFGYVSGEQTLFAGIRKLMPGHHLTLDLRTGQFELQPYWDLPLPAAVRMDDREYVAETRRRLEETVQLRLMSDVPLGVFLSGGVDSSAIAALTQRMTRSRVQTFSVGYAEQRFSELPWAAEVARTIGSDHHEVQLGMRDFFNLLPRLIWHEDEPITWPSSISLYCVSRLASEHVKVVLTGEGSDELFAGYERYTWNLLNYKALAWYRWAPGGWRRALRERLRSTTLLRANLRRKLLHTVLGCGESLESLYLDNFYAAFPDGPASAYASYLQYWNARPELSLLERMLYADRKTYLVELLMKQDQMSMATSIESRVPFLDHQFVEFAAGIPERLKIRRGERKFVFKKAVEDLLPARIVYRKKMGFPTPIRQWLLQPEAQPLFAALLDRRGFTAQYVDHGSLESLLERHARQQEDATDRIWRLLNLQLWGDLYITGERQRWWPGVPAETAAHPGR